FLCCLAVAFSRPPKITEEGTMRKFLKHEQIMSCRRAPLAYGCTMADMLTGSGMSKDRIDVFEQWLSELQNLNLDKTLHRPQTMTLSQVEYGDKMLVCIRTNAESPVQMGTCLENVLAEFNSASYIQ